MKYINRLKNALARLNTKRILRSLIAVSLALLIGSSYVWYTRVYLTPQRRFWMAIENNLSAKSIVRETQTGGTGNLTNEKTRFEFGPIASQDKLSKVQYKTATSESRVSTESITMPTAQYVRYIDVFSSQKKPDGSAYDFSKIKNIWAKQSDSATSKDQMRLSYLQPLITLVPLGYLQPDKRIEIMKQLRSSHAYDVDFGHPMYSDADGRHYVMYGVHVSTKKYVGVLQNYLKDMGLGEFPPLDPANYPDNATVAAQFLVEMRSNTIAAVTFNDQNEHYQDYGVHNPVAIPAKTISVDELQKRLGDAQ